MSSKYTKLSNEVMIKKLKSSINSDIPSELVLDIDSLISNFDRIKVEEMCTKLEILNKEIKDRKKAEDIERKRVEDEERKKVEDEEDSKEEEKEYTSIFKSGEFNEIKNAFGIRLVDENETPLYSSLYEQFKSIIAKYPKLRFYKLSYYDQPEYDPDREYMHINLNSGLVSQAEDIGKYIFGCFRLILNPLSNKCIYNSLMISTIEEPLLELLTDVSMENLFTCEEVLGFDNINTFLDEFQKSESSAVLSEKYLRK